MLGIIARRLLTYFEFSVIGKPGSWFMPGYLIMKFDNLNVTIKDTLRIRSMKHMECRLRFS